MYVKWHRCTHTVLLRNGLGTSCHETFVSRDLTVHDDWVTMSPVWLPYLPFLQDHHRTYRFVDPESHPFTSIPFLSVQVDTCHPVLWNRDSFPVSPPRPEDLWIGERLSFQGGENVLSFFSESGGKTRDSITLHFTFDENSVGFCRTPSISKIFSYSTYTILILNVIIYDKNWLLTHGPVIHECG